MTGQKATARMVLAAEAQDLESIEEALKARAAEIHALAGAPPTAELASRITAAIEDGEKAAAALHAMRHRIRMDCRRLTKIRDGFLTSTPDIHIDYRG